MAATRSARAGGIIIVLLVTLAWLTSFAAAADLPKVRLKAGFSPDAAGQSTTIHFGFTVSTATPLESMTLRLPAGMDLATSTLGLEECEPALLVEGPEACPTDSHLGYGTAFTVAPLRQLGWRFNIDEPVKLTAFYGPPEGERWTVLFYVEGISPVAVERVLVGHLQPGRRPFGEELTVHTPYVVAWNEGPGVALTHFSSTIGPHGLLYTRREHGKTITFTPRGLTVPTQCPSRGFPVQVRFTWWNLPGTTVSRTRVPCPTG